MHETALSKKLKAYFSEIEKVYGEDMAYATASSTCSISDSINGFTSDMFKNYDEEDICLELLISELLCHNGENLMVAKARHLANKSPENYMKEFDEHPSFKPILLRSFIRNSSVSYASRFEQLDEKNQQIVKDAMQQISSYQLARHISKQEENTVAKQLINSVVTL